MTSKSTSTKERFPIGQRVRTTSKGYVQAKQTERFGTVKGYGKSENVVRVTWDGWRLTIAVVTDHLEPIDERRVEASAKLSVTLKVDPDMLLILLQDAVEGDACSHWAKLEDPHPNADSYTSIVVSERDGSYRQRITASDLLIGLQRLADNTNPDFPAAYRHLMDAFDEAKRDMWTADVVLQMTCFGKVIYG